MILFWFYSFRISEQIHPFLRYPFECNTPIKLIGCFSIQVTVLIIAVIQFYSTFMLTFVLCENVTIFISDIEFSLRKLNKRIVKDAKKNRMKLTASQCTVAMKEMNRIMKFYSVARELCGNRFESAFDNFS